MQRNLHSLIVCLTCCLSLFFQSSACIAAACHVVSFFRSLLWVASVASSFTKSFRSSSHLLVGLPALLWVFVVLSSPAFHSAAFLVHLSLLCVAIRGACRHFSFLCVFHPICDAARTPRNYEADVSQQLTFTSASVSGFRFATSPLSWNESMKPRTRLTLIVFALASYFLYSWSRIPWNVNRRSWSTCSFSVLLKNKAATQEVHGTRC